MRKFIQKQSQNSDQPAKAECPFEHVDAEALKILQKPFAAQKLNHTDS